MAAVKQNQISNVGSWTLLFKMLKKHKNKRMKTLPSTLSQLFRLGIKSVYEIYITHYCIALYQFNA